jgi:hypothetical protein
MGSAGAMAERSGSRLRYHADVTDVPSAERLTIAQKEKVFPFVERAILMLLLMMMRFC